MKEPKIRFKGSDYNLSITTLGAITKEYKVLNMNVHHQNLLSLSYGKIIRKDINAKKGLLPASFDTYQLVKENIIVFRVTDLQNDKKSLRVAISKEEGIISPAYVCIECVDENVNPDYLFLLLHFYDVIKKVYYSMGDGMRQTLTYKDLKELQIAYPNMDKQLEIVDYFKKFDSLIQSTTKKIESLKRVKAASLKSMFPQEGETTPRVRFKGFEGEWEKVRASNVFKTFNEKNRPDLPVLSATQDRGMVTRESIGYNIFHDKSNEATYKHILPGQFIIHLRSFQGGFAHSSIEGIASPAYTIIEFKDKTRHFDLYWKYIFMSKEFIKRLELITYGIRDGRSISFEEFSEMNFTVPSYEEQKKIASYITNLDRQITLHTQRLEKLKQIKAACLDKMFV